VELTVGRHAADDGADVDPIVAAALRRRTAPDAPGPARHAPQAARADGDAGPGEGGLGWPGEPGDGTGLGWPADPLSGGPAEGDASAVTGHEVARPARRRGWRRFFGAQADRSTAA
jgi:hypothetical protein